MYGIILACFKIYLALLRATLSIPPTLLTCIAIPTRQHITADNTIIAGAFIASLRLRPMVISTVRYAGGKLRARNRSICHRLNVCQSRCATVQYQFIIRVCFDKKDTGHLFRGYSIKLIPHNCPFCTTVKCVISVVRGKYLQRSSYNFSKSQRLTRLVGVACCCQSVTNKHKCIR